MMSYKPMNLNLPDNLVLCFCCTRDNSLSRWIFLGKWEIYEHFQSLFNTAMAMMMIHSPLILPNPSTTMVLHYGDVIMGTMASQITSLTIVYSIVYSGADQRKHQSSASLAFVRGIHRGPGTGEFPTQMASNTENVSIWRRHHRPS